jgi:hypothetical protein
MSDSGGRKGLSVGVYVLVMRHHIPISARPAVSVPATPTQ